MDWAGNSRLATGSDLAIGAFRFLWENLQPSPDDPSVRAPAELALQHVVGAVRLRRVELLAANGPCQQVGDLQPGGVVLLPLELDLEGKPLPHHVRAFADAVELLRQLVVFLPPAPLEH